MIVIIDPNNRFDTVVLPSATFEQSTLRDLFNDSRKEVIYTGTYQSLKVYFSFGVKVGWLTMKTHDFTIEAKNKAACLSSVFKNLKQQYYKVQCTDEPGILEIDATLEKVVDLKSEINTILFFCSLGITCVVIQYAGFHGGFSEVSYWYDNRIHTSMSPFFNGLFLGECQNYKKSFKVFCHSSKRV